MMKSLLTWIGAIGLSGALLGCPAQVPEDAPNPAEVPGPGPAVEELGPAPAGQSEPPLPDSAPPASSDVESDEDAGLGKHSGDVSVSLMTWDEAHRLVASKTGQVVVLDLWSTACIPCRREFPHLVQLHRDRAGAVACISYSLDYEGRARRPPEFYREKVLDFLTSQGADFDNVLGSDDPDALYERISLASIPAVYVYDRQGTLRKRFDNEDPDREEFTYERDILPFVEELLAES